MSSIPNRLANGIDKRNIIKNITDLYREKGTSVGHKLFFKMLLNDTAELYYPSEDILEASGGKWSYDTIVRVPKGTDITDITVLVGKKITQKNKPLDSTVNLATAIIDTVTLIYYGVVEVLELKINNEYIKGKFIENENIYVTGTDNYVYTFILSPLAVGVTISDPGQNYSIKDTIRVDGFGLPVSMEVGNVLSGYVNDISVKNGGSGYIDNESLIFNETNTNGQGTDAIISGIHGSINMEDGTTTPATPTDPIIIQEDYTVWLSGRYEDKFLLESGSGEIIDTYISRYGQNYNRPPIITAPTGTGAELLPITTSVGSISKINILDPGFDYSGSVNVIPDTTLILHSVNGNFISTETVTFTGGTGVVVSYETDINLLKLKSLTGTANVGDTLTGNLSGVTGTILFNNTATCTVDIGAVHSSVGRFVNEDGFVSSFSKRIQDNYYYQNYSYLVKTAESIINWRSAIKSAVHPAGFAVFGEINIVTLLESKMKVPTLNSTTYTPELFSTFKNIFHTVLRRRLGSDGYGVKNTNPLLGGEGSRDNHTSTGQYDVSAFHNYKIDWIYPTLYFQKESNRAHTLNTIERHKFITHNGYVQGALHPDTGETINEKHGYMMLQFADYKISDFETDPFRKVNIPPPSEITTKNTKLLNVTNAIPIYMNSTIKLITIPNGWTYNRREYVSPTTYTITTGKSYIVHVSGVKQHITDYNVSGTTLTFVSSIPNLADVSIFEIGGNISELNYNGSNTFNVSSNEVIVYINNVIQIGNYMVMSGKVIFDNTVSLSNADEVNIIEVSDMISQINAIYGGSDFYSTGTNYSVTDNTILYINGVYQVPNTNYIVQ